MNKQPTIVNSLYSCRLFILSTKIAFLDKRFGRIKKENIDGK